MKWVYEPQWIQRFGECLVTNYRGRDLVMTAEGGNYIIQEALSREVICRFPKKGQCYEYLKKNYHPR